MSFMRRLLPKPVANTGSQLRDHQANERTFLSWTRMGLAFAAMGLAVGRLGLIEHLFSPQLHTPESTSESHHEKDSPDLLASRLCQGISVWSFGYGLFRYISVRKNLGKGQFVPSIWGPVVMTTGTLGVIGMIIEVDWKRSRLSRN
ncbi:hypothetical protein BDW59DRAFT_177006 [Aspergillus cavernicola]|uniref:DUF202 domain-containing protein n=1 Tax=Aspergillus cavernicola TaxID=176166 RepID=A0ABR4HAI8_9EURO